MRGQSYPVSSTFPFNPEIAESTTHDVVVLAAHRIRCARLPAAEANSRDWRAPEPELGGHALEVDTENGEKRGARGRVRLFRGIERWS